MEFDYISSELSCNFKDFRIIGLYDNQIKRSFSPEKYKRGNSNLCRLLSHVFK